MNGPEHYREAERLLDIAGSEMQDYAAAEDAKTEEYHLNQSIWAQQRAAVHATLALAAATVADRGIGPEEASGWRRLEAMRDLDWEGIR